MKEKHGLWKNFELKIVFLILFIALSLTCSFYFIIFNQYQKLTIENLKNRAAVVHQYVDEVLDTESFSELNTIEDESKDVYWSTQQNLQQIRRIANIRYLYTAKKTDSGEYIYIVDGLDPDAEDFYHVGTLIEDEIVTDLSNCLQDKSVMGDEIKVTEWGIVFVTYFPVHDDYGNVLGAIGMEFDCETLYSSFNRVKMLTIVVSAIIMVVFLTITMLILRRVVKSTGSELLKKDAELIAAREAALEGSKAKSDFLSRMSHEIRTPMNAIIGMTKIAESTNDVTRLKYCLNNINGSSTQLLGLINDILDMSKIEAGKLELENAPLNIEKVLMKVCNLIMDKTEQKNQRLHIQVDPNTHMHFISDELRLSQVLTNLLSNAVKFTNDYGTVTLRVKESVQDENTGLIHFEIVDTGIGMTSEQIGKLFTSFGQAEGSITRRFGGTGLGLAISKSIVEKMGGKIWVESEKDKGSAFIFEIPMEYSHQTAETVAFPGIAPYSLRLLVVDGDEIIRNRFTSITDKFGMRSDTAETGAEASLLIRAAAETGHTYDVVFIDYSLPDMNGIEAVSRFSNVINCDTVVIMTSFLEWHKIESLANDAGIRQFITKPLFQSSILDTINHVVCRRMKVLNIEPETTVSDLPDFSDISLLLTEDVEINREIFITLLEDTNIKIDTAENGLVALEKFKANPQGYDLIVMDVQMPEMDGYEATRLIRELKVPNAKTVPIIAMTANAFKEDVDKCIACGMNDHLAKPIDTKILLEKIHAYAENVRRLG